MKNYCRDKSCI